ncbi:hypothetical protein [Haloechinothrix halophila]|uniref:hypothetical protein n=1 Tax=Haloechinothrix halophila TaxID=1069073 RepID=UPI0012F91476|nr:hypothetical protein [Haloechinothrix halophila]
MAVGFRSFLRVDPGQSLVETVIGHIARWSLAKQIEVDPATPGRYDFADDNVLTIFREHDGDSQIYRWRRVHEAAVRGDVWRTTFTALERPDAPGWLWSEIETVDGNRPEPSSPFACMSVPRVLRDLLGKLTCYDGRTEMTARPQWGTSRNLPDLMDYLADDSRLGAVYIASQGTRETDDFVDWATQVTWHLVGLGSVFLLDNTVNREFNEMVGAGHAVPSGTVRTFLPCVDLDDPRDPQRHKILGIGRITESSPRRLAGMLGLIERTRGAESSLPPEAVELDRVLLAREPGPTIAQPASLHAVTIAEAVMASRSAEHQGATSDVQALREELDRVRAELNQERAQRATILAHLKALTQEINALRARDTIDTAPRQRLSAS